MKDVFRSGDSSKKFKIAEGQWYRYAPSYVSPAYHLLEGFPFIQEPPSGDLQERVLIRHHDYDQCFQSVQLLQWNSQVKFNVTRSEERFSRNAEPLFRSGKVRPNHETNINIIARRTGKDVNSHTVLDGIITTIMATIQRINIIGSREGSRNRRRLKANQTGKKFRVGIKSNISTNRNNLISGVDRCIHLNAMKKTTITSINRQTIKI